MNNDNQIQFLDDQGHQVSFYVLEQTIVNGSKYLLTADSTEDDEGIVFIMKEISEDGEYVSYEIVEEEQELEAISGIFNAMMDGIDLTL